MYFENLIGYEKVERITYSLQTIDQVVSILIKKMKTYKTFAFHGDMGSGKTTVIRALLEHAHIDIPVTSPTFAYVNTYLSSTYKTRIHHFDLYRLSTIDEFYALALDDLLNDREAFIFIEWPDLIMPIIKKDHNVCELFFNYGQDLEQRIITIKEPTD